MKLASWILTIFGAWAFAVAVNYAALDTELSWTVSLSKQKEEIAAKYANQGRILFVGGSQTHYSVSAEQTEAALGCPAVNMGLHAGLGLNTMAATAETLARAGDLVVFYPEYALLRGDGTGWLSAGYGVARGRPGLGGDSVKTKLREFLRSGVVSLRTFGKSAWVLLFDEKGRGRDTVGPRGDVVTFMSDMIPPGDPVNAVISQHALTRLTRLRDNLETSGARLVISLPWRLIRNTDHKSLMGVQRIVAKLRGVTDIISGGVNLNLHIDASLFSDSDYHASAQGRRQHTSDIIAALREYSERSGWPCALQSAGQPRQHSSLK